VRIFSSNFNVIFAKCPTKLVMVGPFKNNLKGVQIPKFCTFGSFLEFLNVFIFHPILMYFWQNESAIYELIKKLSYLVRKKG
jgi:hypothetical protein